METGSTRLLRIVTSYCYHYYHYYYCCCWSEPKKTKSLIPNMYVYVVTAFFSLFAKRRWGALVFLLNWDGIMG